MSTALVWVAVAVAGAVGALARTMVTTRIARRVGIALPWGTIAVNGSGCLALGVFVGAGIGGDAARIVDTALIGAYTTFSAWLYESDRLGARGRQGWAVANVVGSVALGIVLLVGGRALGRQIA